MDLDLDVTFQGITVRPGDTLMLLADHHLTAEQADRISKEIREHVPDTVKVFILDGFRQMAVVLGREV